jgi:hypothetical protein
MPRNVADPDITEAEKKAPAMSPYAYSPDAPWYTEFPETVAEGRGVLPFCLKCIYKVELVFVRR